MQKIRTYLVQIKNVFAFLDGLGRILHRTLAVAIVAIVLVIMGSMISESQKNIEKKDTSKSELSVDNEQAVLIEVNKFNVSVPEVNVNKVEQTTIVEELFLSGNAKLESVEIELSGVTSVEPEAGISQVVTDTVASPVYTAAFGNYTQADLVALQKIVQSEAGICDIKGKILVANVIINRVRDKRFPNTIEEVILQPVQFSPVADGNYAKAVPTAETIEAVERALNGEDYSQGALFFASTACVNSGGCWAAKVMRRLFEHDGHVFFAP